MNNPFSSWAGFDIDNSKITLSSRDHLLDKFIKELQEELEESLLACLAAGVPVDCIEVVPTQPNIVWQSDRPYTLTRETKLKFKYKL
jgi:hypothetical protein